MNKRGKTPPRYDLIDAFLTVWIAILVWLDAIPSWLPGSRALLFLFVLLLLRRVAVPNAARSIQLLSVFVLAIASGSIIAVSAIQNLLLRAVGTNLFFLAAWLAANEFIRHPFGVTVWDYMNDRSRLIHEEKSIRALLVGPGLEALIVCVGAAALQTFWDNALASQVALALWLIPFLRNWVFLRRVPPTAAQPFLDKQKPSASALGSLKIVLAAVGAISAVGFIFEHMFRHNYAAWSVVSGLLLLQALAIFQTQRWTSRLRVAG